MTLHSLPPGSARYFLALVPPDPIYGQCMDLKNYFSEVHNSRGALRSPPHITLHMPFNWADKKINKLIDALENFTARQPQFEIQLNGFDCFEPRVIFIRVEPTSELNNLHKKTEQLFKIEFNLFNAVYRNEPFTPHLTIAFRDLKKEAFHVAWPTFKNKSFRASWKIENLCLLKHDGQKWQPFKWFQLGVATN